MKIRLESKDINFKISFAVIKFVHDNWLLRRLVDPAALLRELGLKLGDAVWEVGCGPGFYTMGAAEVTGPKGKIYTYDINPYAIEYVRRKVENAGLDNIQAENKTAADTGLPNDSIDFAFVVGVPHIVGGTHNLLDEITRVVKPEGLLAYRPSRENEEQLIHDIKNRGFNFECEKKKFLIFRCQNKQLSKDRNV